MSDTLEQFSDLFRNGVCYLYDAEKQLIKALPKMADAASSPELKQGFESHLQDTKQQADRLEQIASKLSFSLEHKNNKVLEAMTNEAEHMISNSERSPLRDAALIVAGNQVEHYEMGSYGALISFARLLGYRDVEPLLEQSLSEEKRADQKLTELAESQINEKALHSASQGARA